MYRLVNIRDKFDIDIDFWEDNPWLKFIDPFSKIYERDKSKNKIASSKQMHCIWLYCDPHYKNKIGKMDEASKKDAILTYYPDFDFEDEIIQECLLKYRDKCLSPAARAFKIEEETLIKRADFLNNAEYKLPSVIKDEKGKIIYVNGRPLTDPGTAKDLDSMRKLSLDLFKKYAIIKKEFEEEQAAEGEMYGKGERTLMDEGGLVLVKDGEEDE